MCSTTKGAVTLSRHFFMQFCCDASCTINLNGKCNIPRQQLVSQFLLLPQVLQKVELHSTFRKDCSNDFIDFSALRSVTSSVQRFSQCFARSGSSLSSPQSSSVAVLRVTGSPLHSVTPLLVQLQWYPFKCCATNFTKKLLVYCRLKRKMPNIFSYKLWTILVTLYLW